MTKNAPNKPATIAAQAAHQIDEVTGAVIPPIHLAATYARDENYDKREGYMYSRYGVPTTHQAEEVIRQLEGAAVTTLFNSGLSAASAVMEILPKDAKIILPVEMYYGVRELALRLERKGLVSVDTYMPGDMASMAAAVGDQADLLWVETPNNPTFHVTDIAAAAEIAKRAGAKLVVDSTIAPPCTTQALALGADFAFHSGTKYINGHSDVTAGVLSSNDVAAMDEIDAYRRLQGTFLPGFEAWLLMRGVRTLFVRFEKASANAARIAAHFDDHPLVDAVLYPGLPSHPGHAVANRQMTNGFSGMMALLVKGSFDQAKAAAAACQIFLPATSLGGVESLIEHRKTVEGLESDVPANLLRLSVGIEDADDLIADLEQALARACG